ncbi:hypothetical protein D7030_01300 [Flavobacteriaceae bacterium AU392]|nr:hypothetical protein D1817_07755 [Flavobacteriaceae bacterium]RKM86515.1 hypothetical protein D7030_01300 [Flavobacteriaceae bacterium AU392]
MALKDKSTGELNGELKALKLISAALISIMSLLLIVCTYGLVTKEKDSIFTALLIIPPALGVFIPLNYGKMKKIKKELDGRN